MTEPTTLSPALETLLARFREGRTAALARAISVVEDGRPGFQPFLHAALAAGPRARRVGLTGPPGAGKSSLVAAVAAAYRAGGERVGVVAVDPTSPFSGGALLGDRIRMNDIATDPGLFIRSMATRGSLGGLAATTKEVVDLVDAFGLEHVLVETVGVGQTELEISKAADTVVVVLVPESGDSIQAMKAGLMEIADVFVVNKADRPGSARLVKEIRQSLHLRAGRALENVPAHHGVDLGKAMARERSTPPAPAEESAWSVPVLTTNALEGEGVDELVSAVAEHQAWLRGSGELQRRRRLRAAGRIRDVVERSLVRAAWASDEAGARVEAGVEAIAGGSATPYSVAEEIVRSLLR